MLTELSESHFAVAGCVRLDSQKSSLPRGPAIKPIVADLAVFESAAVLLEQSRPDRILHLAAHVPSKSDPPKTDTQSDRDTLGATQTLLEACARYGSVSHFVFASTISVYPPSAADGKAHREQDPTAAQEAYGKNKITCERAVATWAKTTQQSATILRLAGIHGPPRNCGIVYALSRAVLKGATVTVSEPDTVLAPLFIEDAVSACIAATSRSGKNGDVLICNVGGPEGIRLADIASIIVEEAGRNSQVTFGSATPRRSVMAIDRAMVQLEWEPRRFRASVRNALREWTGAPGA